MKARCEFRGGPWDGRLLDLKVGASGAPPVVWKVPRLVPTSAPAYGARVANSLTEVEHHLYDRGPFIHGAAGRWVYWVR